MKMTYNEALAFMSKTKDMKKGRPVGRNTRMRCHIKTAISTLPVIDIQYYQTGIVALCHDKTLLRNGGWHSITTKQRLNEWLPMNMRIYQKDFTWYLQHNDVKHELPHSFAITITNDGEVKIV